MTQKSFVVFEDWYSHFKEKQDWLLDHGVKGAYCIGFKDALEVYEEKYAGTTEATKKLEAQIEQLVYLHNEDVNTIKLLNKQIEEMRCCGNCAKYNSGYGENPCKISASGLCGEWETSIGKF